MVVKNNSITKHNALIKASYRLTLNEMRLVLYGISFINPLTKEFPTELQINIGRFATMFGIDKEGVYDDLKQSVVKRFWYREFSYIENDTTKMFRWLDQVDYCKKRGYLKLYFSERIKPLLSNLNKSFTTYYINQISSFKSIYSVRIYEICIMEYNKQKKHNGDKPNKAIVVFMLVSKLRELLMLENKYKYFRDIKKYILEKARTEINKYSDIKMSYEIEKEGHTPHEIIFILKRKKTKEDQAKIEERALKEEEKRKWKELPLATILQQRVQRIEECSEN